MRRTADINADIGEGFENDNVLMDIISTASVCCGSHAGSRELTRETVRRAGIAGVRVGAHPGFPDRENMGRATPEPGEFYAYMVDVEQQIVWFLTQFKSSHIKFHGALYNMIAREKQFSSPEYRLLIDLLKSCHVPLMGLPGTGIARLAELSGLGFIKEGFADRRYTEDGFLVPRSAPEAIITSPAEARTRVTLLAPRVDTICVHGDEPNCVAVATMVRAALIEDGYEVAHWSSR